MTDDRGRMAEDRKQMTEDGGQMTDGGRRRADDSGLFGVEAGAPLLRFLHHLAKHSANFLTHLKQIFMFY